MTEVKYVHIDGISGKFNLDTMVNIFGSQLDQFLCRVDSNGEGFYHIERPRNAIQTLVDYSMSGKLHIPENICISSFISELEFWNIPIYSLEPCCYHKYKRFASKQKHLQGFENMVTEMISHGIPSGEGYCTRKCLWNVVDRRSNSWTGKVIFIWHYYLVRKGIILLIRREIKSLFVIVVRRR